MVIFWSISFINICFLLDTNSVYMKHLKLKCHCLVFFWLVKYLVFMELVFKVKMFIIAVLYVFLVACQELCLYSSWRMEMSVQYRPQHLRYFEEGSKYFLVILKEFLLKEIFQNHRSVFLVLRLGGYYALNFIFWNLCNQSYQRILKLLYI